jgi:threonine/homoserine/homoserine lactone efflux protein
VIGADQVLGLALACVVLIAVPGPTVLFVVGRALAYGRRVAAVTAAGNALGTLAVVACVALGLGPVLQSSALAYDAIRLAGAAYLVWLGIKALRSAEPAGGSDGAPVGACRRGGLAVNAARRRAGRADESEGVRDPGSGPPAVRRPGRWRRARAAVPARAGAGRAGPCHRHRVGAGGGVGPVVVRPLPAPLLTFSRAGGAAMIGLGVSVAVTGRK